MVLSVKLPQRVHIVFQYFHDAFNSNHAEVSTIIMLIFTHKCILLSEAECNPYSVNVFLYVHTKAQHPTPHHNTTHTPQQWKFALAIYVAIPTVVYDRIVSLRLKTPSYVWWIRDKAWVRYLNFLRCVITNIFIEIREGNCFMCFLKYCFLM
jgi:hypothetical protein